MVVKRASESSGCLWRVVCWPPGGRFVFPSQGIQAPSRFLSDAQALCGEPCILEQSVSLVSCTRPYGHCIVAGIQKYPLKITKSMPEKKIAKRSRVKPFIKSVNYNHMMPTRYTLDIELKSLVTADVVSGNNPTAKSSVRKDVKKLLEDKYNNSLRTGKSKWFFQKLRF